MKFHTYQNGHMATQTVFQGQCVYFMKSTGQLLNQGIFFHICNTPVAVQRYTVHCQINFIHEFCKRILGCSYKQMSTNSGIWIFKEKEKKHRKIRIVSCSFHNTASHNTMKIFSQLYHSHPPVVVHSRSPHLYQLSLCKKQPTY